MTVIGQDQLSPTPGDRPIQANGLSRLLHLIQQMRRSQSIEELQFLAMNESRQIIVYDEALLFFDLDGASPALQCISGLATFEHETPKIAWLEKNIAGLRKTDTPGSPRIISLADIPENHREGWQEFLSPEAIIIPFNAKKSGIRGFFLFTRAQSWGDNEIKLLSEIAENFAYAYDGHKSGSRTVFLQTLKHRKNRLFLIAAIITAVVMFWPVRETLVADMEVTPIAPWVATAPIDGIVRKIHVESNAPVKAGDLLFEIDDTTLRNEVILANERLEIAKQELWQARQQAVSRAPDDKKADASLLSLEVKKRENEARYNEELLAKTKVTAGADGIAIFSSASEIEGRPARTGEAVMLIASPDQIELTINMPVADAIVLNPGDPVRAYLHATPFAPLDARIRYISYKAQRTEIADQYAYRIKADLDPGQDKPRLGLKGTARVKGERTTLFYVLFRKPISYIRRMTGI